MIERLWRRLTDRRVWCVTCGDSVGYVVRRGHARWLCARCSWSGNPEAV